MTDTTPSSNEAPESIPVTGQVREILLRLVAGWQPDVLDPGLVQSFRLNETDFTEMAPNVAFAGDRLSVTLRGAHVHPRLRELLPFPMGASADGTLVGGGTFRGADIARISLGADLTIEMSTWFVLNGDEPSIWIGRLDGSLPVDFGGNMVVERTRADGLRLGHGCHFRFAGTYTSYLVQSGPSEARIWHWVVDTDAGMPDREALERDFQVLQFVLGRQLRAPILLGIGGDGQTVAVTTGAGTRSSLHPRSAPPVPINRDNDDRIDASWASLLFDRVSAMLTARPDTRTPIWMALDSYLDSMGQHLDADYLRLHVGLEALAYWWLRLNNEDERMVVKDKTAWKRWVKENSGSIRALAAEGFEESLVNKVMGVYRLSSGRVVPSAFLAHGLPLPEELSKELEERDVVVHQGLMAPEGYDADRDFRRIAMVRTLLVALICKAVGYNGAINGWERGRAGYALEPTSWWSVNENDRKLAHRVYVAEVSADDGEIAASK